MLAAVRALASGVSRGVLGAGTPAPATADGQQLPQAPAALESGALSPWETARADAGLPRARDQTPEPERRRPGPVQGPRRSPRGHPPAGAGDGQHDGAELLPPGRATHVRRRGASERVRYGNPRTISQMRAKEAKRKVHALPEDFPRGPWPDVFTAQKAINAWAGSTDEGGFGVIASSLRHGVGVPECPGPNDHGIQRVLQCHDRARGCKWAVTLENCVDGWAVYSFSDCGHNHELTQSMAEVLARPTMRDIPEDLVVLGKELYKTANMGPAAIYRWMKAHLDDKGRDARFTVKDVEYAVGVSTGEKRLDATNLVERLRQREVEQGLFHRVQTNGEGQLTHVFMQMAGSHAIYADEVERQVVEIDTKVRAHHALSTRRHPHTQPRIHSTAPTSMA